MAFSTLRFLRWDRFLPVDAAVTDKMASLAVGDLLTTTYQSIEGSNVDAHDFSPAFIHEAASDLACRIMHWQRIRPATTCEEFRLNFTEAVLDCARDDLKTIGRRSPMKMWEVLGQFPEQIQALLKDNEIMVLLAPVN
jgi:hypothetical protein